MRTPKSSNVCESSDVGITVEDLGVEIDLLVSEVLDDVIEVDSNATVLFIKLGGVVAVAYVVSVQLLPHVKAVLIGGVMDVIVLLPEGIFPPGFITGRPGSFHPGSLP